MLEACYAVGGAAAVPNVAPACLGDLMTGQLTGQVTGFTQCLVTGNARRWGGKGAGGADYLGGEVGVGLGRGG